MFLQCLFLFITVHCSLPPSSLSLSTPSLPPFLFTFHPSFSPSLSPTSFFFVPHSISLPLNLPPSQSPSLSIPLSLTSPYLHLSLSPYPQFPPLPLLSTGIPQDSLPLSFRFSLQFQRSKLSMNVCLHILCMHQHHRVTKYMHRV